MDGKEGGNREVVKCGNSVYFWKFSFIDSTVGDGLLAPMMMAVWNDSLWLKRFL